MVLVLKVSLVACVQGGIYLLEMGSKTVSEAPGFGEFSLCIPGVWHLHRGFPTLHSLFSVRSQRRQPHHQTPFEMLIIPSMQKKKKKMRQVPFHTHLLQDLQD